MVEISPSLIFGNSHSSNGLISCPLCEAEKASVDAKKTTAIHATSGAYRQKGFHRECARTGIREILPLAAITPHQKTKGKRTCFPLNYSPLRLLIKVRRRRKRLR